VRDTREVAKRLFDVRERWQRAIEAPVPDGVQARERRQTLEELESELRALAWVLGVDVAQFHDPGAVPALEPSDSVTLTEVNLGGLRFWLMEVPANLEPGQRTEYWAAFLSDRHLHELGEAIMRALSEKCGRVRWR
jgi:hypothetical protein